MRTLNPPKTLVEQAYETILDAIASGTLKPNERLTQDELAARLNVSRQPVMSALATLKAQGFLAEAGRRGLVVAPIDPRRFAEIYQFRAAVEPLAVRLATAHLTAAASQRAQQLLAQGRAAVAAGDARAVLQADVDFHAFIYELSGNRLIAESMRPNWHHLRRGMGEVLKEPKLAARVWDEHAAIVAAMDRGDAEGAAELMRSHIVVAYQRVRRRDPAIAAGTTDEILVGVSA